MEVIDKVREFINDLIASLQKAKLYSPAHQIFKDSIDKAYSTLQEVLKERGQLIIGIISGELAFEKEIFFDLSSFDLAKKMITLFQKRGIEKIIFYPYVDKNELEMFIAFLFDTSKEEIKTSLSDYLISLGIRNIAVGQISVLGITEEMSQEAAGCLKIYEDYLSKAGECAQIILNNEVTDFPALKIAMIEITENLGSRPQEVLKLVIRQRQRVSAFLHSINVSILAIYFSYKLGFSRNDILDIGMAALFHDIGRIYIAKKLAKENNLAEEQSGNTKSHTQWGAQILLRHVVAIGLLPVLVSFEHHLRYDLKGYPKLSFGYKPHIASLIVSICDVYNTFFQRRNPKYDYSPDAIHDLMMKGKGSVFEPDLLDNFFKIMGIWPIGTLVLLSDGRVAVVRQENENDMLKPQIEVIYPEGKKELIDLKGREKELKIERALNPFTEGKIYLHLI